MTLAIIQSGFCHTRNFPVNFNAIGKAKFVPAQVTDSKDSLEFLCAFMCWLQMLCIYFQYVHFLLTVNFCITGFPTEMTMFIKYYLHS